jgi:hypothetical protein
MLLGVPALLAIGCEQQKLWRFTLPRLSWYFFVLQLYVMAVPCTAFFTPLYIIKNHYAQCKIRVSSHCFGWKQTLFNSLSNGCTRSLPMLAAVVFILVLRTVLVVRHPLYTGWRGHA